MKKKADFAKSDYDIALEKIKNDEKKNKAARIADMENEKVDKKKLKQMEAEVKRRKKAKSSIPRTTQQSIPYLADFEYGLFEIAPNVYSKTFDFTDVNYQIARVDDQISTFCKWGETLNYFSSDMEMSYTINNKISNKKKLLDDVLIEPLAEHEDDVEEFNKMLTHQFNFGRNDITKERYITIAIHADNIYDAINKFKKIEVEIKANFARMGSTATLQSTERRLEILHDFYRPHYAGELNIDFKNIKEQGLSSKDYIAPSGIFWKRDCFKIDDTWYKCVQLTNLPSNLVDTIMSDLTDFSFPMMATVSVKAIDMDKAIRLVKSQITGMESMKIEAQKKAVRAGFDPELSINHDLRYALEEAEILLSNIQTQNQKMFNATITICFSGETLQDLEENQLLLESVARQKICQLQVLKYQQEEALAQTLPLGHNTLPLRRTLTTESLGIFIPFTSQELNHKNGVYYSLNQITKNLIRVDRKRLNNANGFIFGESGSGKTFAVKKEILSRFLSLPNETIFIIDPEAEYVRLVEKLGGQVIKIGTGISNFINIFDMSENYSIDGDALAEKIDFIMSVCECMAKGLTPSQVSIIDYVVGILYMEYMQTYDEKLVPTLETFYEKLLEQEEQQAKDLALSIRTYATGSLSIFAKKTNIDLKNRLICFDTSSMGKNLQNIGLLVVQELIWNKLVSNRNKLSTSIYMDEFHLMLKNPISENFAEQLFARIRKYGGMVTGITQNVDKLLQSEIARGMLGNTKFTIMLSQSDTNRQILAKEFSIGEEQLSYITDADKGTGLIRAGGVIVPFGDEFPKDNKLYRYMTSDADEIKYFDELEAKEKATLQKKKIKDTVYSGESVGPHGEDNDTKKE